MGIALSLSFPDGFLLQVNKNQEKSQMLLYAIAI